VCEIRKVNCATWRDVLKATAQSWERDVSQRSLQLLLSVAYRALSGYQGVATHNAKLKHR